MQCLHIRNQTVIITLVYYYSIFLCILSKLTFNAENGNGNSDENFCKER